MDFNYSSKSTNVNDLLYSAQIITDAFAKTLEENNCLLILTIGLHQEITNSIKDIEDVVETVTESNNALEKGSDSSVEEQILNNLTSTLADIKDSCFTCKLQVPKIDFNVDLQGVMGKLKAQLQLYTEIFKVSKFDLCQASYALQSACLPDILKLITLILTAYVSIMTLKKLSSISITAFIKGVLSMLLSKLTQSLKITVNIGSSNVSCLINALKEIALSVPTEENIQKQLDSETQTALGLIDANGQKTDSNLLKSKMTSQLNKTLNDQQTFLDSGEKYVANKQKQINEAFTVVSDVADLAVDEVNNYVQSLLSFQDHFECETARSGMDVSEAMASINKVIQVLNLLSAVALSIAKKEVRAAACKTEDTINELSATEISDLQIKDIIEDFNQKTVEIIESSESGLQVIIHEQPKSSALPKITMLDCSIDNFIEAHTLPKILEVAKKQVEQEKTRTTPSGESNEYIFKKPTPNQVDNIDSIVNIIYDVPVTEDKKTEERVVVDIKNPIGPGNISNILSDVIRKDKKQTDLSCKSVEDVLNILNNMKR